MEINRWEAEGFGIGRRAARDRKNWVIWSGQAQLK